MKKTLSLAMLLLSFTWLAAQTTQTIRGRIVDDLLQTPLAGATVTLTETLQTTLSDSLGHFRFDNIPVGTYSLQASFVGYGNASIANLAVLSGKEQVIIIGMQPAMANENNVVVKGASKKNKPLNTLSVVSARAFTVEETQQYAAAVNDPSRMATAYAGVVGADDGNNSIVIRGNAPNGLLWRMEGIEIPNPNHFAASGTSSGGISILSAQLLSNSDFLTGAFAAEYGNAQSGVFDLKLRTGNDEKREYTLQAGFLGLNAAAEGPFKKGSKASYLINYRYSTLSLLSKMGLDVGDASTDFQDYAYNIYLPTKKAGTFTLFGFGGFSSQTAGAEKDSTIWQGDGDRYGWNAKGRTILVAATHRIALGNKTMLNSAVAWSNNYLGETSDYVKDDLTATPIFSENNITRRTTLSSTINHRFDSRNLLRAGLIFNEIGYNYLQLERENIEAPLLNTLLTNGNTQTMQSFAQWHHNITPKLSTNIGLHTLSLLLNNTTAIEPRASVQYNFSPAASLSFGYGMHHRVHPLGVYFGKPAGDVSEDLPNKNLDFTTANHYVLSWQQQLGTKFRLRTELYYQQLSRVAVGIADSSTFSVLNHEYGFITQALDNAGKGRNYGVEISLERYLHRNFYLLWSNSLYQSKYTAKDGIERNTRFNGNYATTLTTGKDWLKKGGRKIIGLNLKTVYNGGLRQTPVDLEASKIAGYAIYKEQEAYSTKLPNYFRADLRASITWNKNGRSSTLSLDVQNLSNNANVFGNYYDATKQEMVIVNALGILPILNYKIQF